MYLEVNVLTVYLEMEEADQTIAKSIKNRLKTTNLECIFDENNKLRRVNWTGESMDVYAAEINCIAGLAGYTGCSLEKIIKLPVVSGLPDRISMELQRLTRIETMEVEILSHARVLAKSQ